MSDITTVVVTPTVSPVYVNQSAPGSYDSVARLSLGWYNVKEAQYGAKGDGTTDDRAAIQAAITACYAAGGGTVFFPPGTYLLATPQGSYKNLLRPRSGVTLLGCGAKSVLKAGNGLNTSTDNRGYTFIGHVVADESISSCDNFAVLNLYFDHNGANNLIATGVTATYNAALEIDVGTNIRFEGNYCLNNPGRLGVILGQNASPQACANVVVRGNIFHNVSDGVSGNTHATDHSTVRVQAIGATITDNQFVNDSAASFCTAIEVHSTDAVVTNNVAINYGVFCNLCAVHADGKHVTVSRNVGRDIRTALNLWTASSYVADQLSFSDNIMHERSTNATAVAFVDLTTNVATLGTQIAVRNNQLVCDLAAGTSGIIAGVRVGKLTRVEITGNVFRGFQGRAIDLDGAVIDTTLQLKIEGNTIEDCGTTSNASFRQGIALNSLISATFVRIANNTVRNIASTYMTTGIQGNMPMTYGEVVENSVGGVAAEVRWNADTNVLVRATGSGSPASVVRSLVGGTWLRTDGGTTTTLYVKESGVGTTSGWVAK